MKPAIKAIRKLSLRDNDVIVLEIDQTLTPDEAAHIKRAVNEQIADPRGLKNIGVLVLEGGVKLNTVLRKGRGA